MTVLHALLGAGTALAPLIAALLARGGQWWLLPLAIAVAVVLIVLAFALAGLACSACLPLGIGTARSGNPRLVETISGRMVAAYIMGYGIGAFAGRSIRGAAANGMKS